MQINEKDSSTLVRLPNKYLAEYHARVMIENANESICRFYEHNSDKINGKVVVVRSKEDEGGAAIARNSERKVLFVFHENYWVTSYFSGVCQNIKLPKVLLNRVRKCLLTQDLQ